MFANLEDVIRQHVSLSHRKNSRGWYPVLCKVCNDHGKKGKRAGFHFEGTKVGYNCFNCGHAAVYDPTEHKSMTKDMKTVLEAFGVPKEEWQKVLLSAMASPLGKERTSQTHIRQTPEEIAFPTFFYRLTNDPNDDWAQAAIEHLAEKRKMSWENYPFYLSRLTDDPHSKQWYGRLIIPVFYKDKIIFYQGRDLSGQRSRKYMSPESPRDNVLFGYENIEKDTEAPLYVVEGFFDAVPIEGVAVFGPKITPQQLSWLKDTRRPKVVIPDRFGDGIRLAEQAIELGWAVSTPDIGQCKDISDAIVKYGLLYTLRTIKDHTSSGFEAATKVQMYCKK